MKRGIFILVLALVAGAVTFCVWHFVATRQVRVVMESGEMEWLRQEFDLNESEFGRVMVLHDVFRPKCEALCMRILDANAKTRELMDSSGSVTPELDAALREAAAVQAECHAAMLAHAYAVGNVMGGSRGERYFSMMKSRALTEPLMQHHGVTTREY